MIKSVFITTAAATLLATSAAFAVTTVRDVEVEADLTAIQNESAAAYWTTMADDLETAIVSRLTDQLADDGASVSVDIDELSLANTFQSILGIEKSELIGTVSVSNLADNSEFQNYTLTVSFEPSPIVLSPDANVVHITRTTSEYYAQMIATFADRVAEKLQE